MADLSGGQIKEKALRDGGFTDEEIDQWKGQAAQQLQGGGFSAKEIKDYFGQQEPDLSKHLPQVKQNLSAYNQQQKATAGDQPSQAQSPVEAQTILDAMKAGWQGSFSGLFTRGKMPDIQPSQNASVAQTFAAGAAQMAGDLPAMFAGGTAGLELGPIGVAAGAFAAPAAFRKMLIDQYQQQGEVSTSDIVRRAVSATWEAAKGATVGVASEVTGGVAGALAGTTAKVAAEIAAQTTVSNALEGRLPTKKDFINGAVAVGGLHAVGFGLGKVDYVAKKMMNIYSETGAHPGEIIEAANNDPHFKGQLLSENPDIPIKTAEQPPAEAPVEDVAKPPEPTSDQQMVTSAKDEILSRIGEKPEPEKAPLTERIKDNFTAAYAKHLDYTKVIGDVINEIGDQPLDEKNAQVLMRLHAAVSDKVQQFIEIGTRDFKTGEINGEPLIKVFDDYKAETGDAGLDNLKAYGIAKRSLELADRGLEQPGDRGNDQAFVEANPQLDKYMQRLTDYKNRVLDYLGDSGRYSKESVQAMKDMNKSYISFKKILEPDPLTGETPATSKAIKKIGSSDLQLQDPILSTLRDVDRMIRLAQETHAVNAFVENMSKAEDPSEFFRVSENQKGFPSKSQIASYVDGNRTLYDVPPEVADSIKRMEGNPQAMSIWTSLLKPFATALRVGTVDNPLFAARHAWRNQLTAPTLSQTGLKPFEALLYAPEYLTKGDSYHDFVYDGGAVQSIVPLQEGYLDGKIYQLDDKAPFLDKAWNKVKTAAEFSHWAIVMNDNIVRFAEYKRMLEKGSTRAEAAFAAREVLPDFQKAGLQRSALNSITAFLNVHLQGMSRMVQETADNPAGYIAKNLAYITVPSILLYAAQKDDDAVKDLPSWQKYNYWPIHVSNWRDANTLAEAMSVKAAYPSNVRQLPDGKWQVNDGTIVRIQKPFTNGILFGSAFEATLDAWSKKDPKAFKDFLSTIGGSTFVEPIPTALNPVLEQAVNRNFYTGQSVVRQSMENKLPEMQYDQYTSDTAKVLGKLISYVPLIKDIGPKDARLSSPQIIDNYLHGWGGTLGYYAIDVLDKGLQASGITPQKIKPVDTLADIPFVREFVIRFPNAKPQSVTDFSDRYKEADRVSNSIRQLIKQGDVDGAIKLQDRYAINMDRLRGADKAIQNMNAAVQKINQASDIDPVQKRQLIDGLMYQMTSVAKHGNDLMDEFEKQVKNKKAAGQ